MRISNLGGLLLVGFVAGCGASPDYEPPALPPPPPPVPAVEPAPMPEPYSPSSQAAPPPMSSSWPEAPSSGPPSSAVPSSPPPPVAPPTANAGAAAPPPAGNPTTYVQTYPSGQWVYLAERGWVWVPSGTETVESEGVPYAYLYTPTVGWTWYVSPWGWGPYRYGAWIRHPWHPVGWHGHWVAHPHVVVRLGPRHYHR